MKWCNICACTIDEIQNTVHIRPTQISLARQNVRRQLGIGELKQGTAERGPKSDLAEGCLLLRRRRRRRAFHLARCSAPIRTQLQLPLSLSRRVISPLLASHLLQQRSLSLPLGDDVHMTSALRGTNIAHVKRETQR